MALQYLEAQRQARPDLDTSYAEFSELYQRKLWHQLTLKIDLFIKTAPAQMGDTFIQLYHNFICDFETNINPMRLAEFAVSASSHYVDKDDAIHFLKCTIIKLVKMREQIPVLLLKMQLAALNLKAGNQNECKTLLEEGKIALDGISDVDLTVYASYYWTYSQYHKSREDRANYYNCTLQYLASTSQASLPESMKMGLAFDLTCAALLMDNFYDFGELLNHPIINSLIGTKLEWMYQMLRAFNTGDVARYNELCDEYSAAMSAVLAQGKNKKKLREKITILCLMEIIFSLPSDARTIQLSVVEERTGLSTTEVECLLMKSISDHLIEGTVDEVDRTVHVSWIKPRVLGIQQVKVLSKRLESWDLETHSRMVSFEAETLDILEQ